ncbi:MAG: hypothetical protein LC729_00520 [Acidobacteria bacterium]|nr:hypothetical protein [Acidobacteriota bacterium]
MRLTSRAGTKVGLSDLRVPSGRARNHRIKATRTSCRLPQRSERSLCIRRARQGVAEYKSG